MATTGEIIWAQLIARNKKQHNLFHELRGVFLTFRFGPYIEFTTPLVPIRDFVFREYQWLAPSRIRPKVHIHFVYKKRLSLISEKTVFRIQWDYIWRGSEIGPQTCVFREGAAAVFAYVSHKSLGRYSGLRRIRFAYVRSRFSYKTPILTPTQFFNLSLIAGVLVPKGISTLGARVKLARGPFAMKKASPRPNPEIRTAGFKNALEFSGVPYSEGVDTLEIFRRSWTGITTPNFGSKKKRQLPVNPHTVSIVKTKWTVGYDLRKKAPGFPPSFSNGWGATYYPNVSPPAATTDSQLVQVENTAIKRLNANANLGVQANMAQNLAQYRQTTNMIANSAFRISRSILALKKGQFSQAANLLFDGKPRNTGIRKGKPSNTNSLANNWLELQYGWKPLLSDVDESMRILADYMVKTLSAQQVKASAMLTRENAIPIYGPGSNTIPIGVERVHGKWQVRFGVNYTVSSPVTSYLSQLGFTNPINLVWEILPYSFVVDWFIPIGPYLESLSAPHGLTFHSGFKTLYSHRIINVSVSHSGAMPGDATAELRAYGDRYQESVAIARAALISYPVQSFPQFKNPFSTTHAFNALALLKQAFK
jgi:hypothetical protein